MTTESSLQILTEVGPVYFPPGSAQQLRVEMSHVSQGELRRDVNGRLVDLTRAVLRKWRITVSASGMAFGDMRGGWQGVPVTVIPPVTWSASAPAGVTKVYLERPAAAGTWRLIHATTGVPISGAVRSSDGLSFTLPVGHPAAILEYQPTFECLIADVSLTADEWAAGADWSMTFEEV